MLGYGNPMVIDALRRFSKEDYFSEMSRMFRSFGLPVPHSQSLLHEDDYELLKATVLDGRVFTAWANNFVRRPSFTKRRLQQVFCCWVAALAVSLMQQRESATSFTGKTSRTDSFNVDTGNLTDRYNECLTTAYKLMGSRASTNFKVRRLGC